jgi:ribosomal protein S18 acetylase RimI-like enzyme
MKPGKVVKAFTAKNGQKVVLRYSKKSDVLGLLHYINSLVEEGAEIAMAKKMGLKQEKKWLDGVLRQIKANQQVHIVAVLDGKIVGGVEIKKGNGKREHTGLFGIGLLKEARRLGIAKELIKAVFAEARKIGVTHVNLDVYSSNKRAQKIYRAAGFRKSGVLPGFIRMKGRPIDNIIMWRKI